LAAAGLMTTPKRPATHQQRSNSQANPTLGKIRIQLPLRHPPKKKIFFIPEHTSFQTGFDILKKETRI